MPQGLQVFDADGNVIFDLSNNTSRIIDVIEHKQNQWKTYIKEYIIQPGEKIWVYSAVLKTQIASWAKETIDLMSFAPLKYKINYLGNIAKVEIEANIIANIFIGVY